MKNKVTLAALEKECMRLESEMDDICNDMYSCKCLSVNMSDDTKALKKRPFKRVINICFNLDSHYLSHKEKRVHLLDNPDIQVSGSSSSSV